MNKTKLNFLDFISLITIIFSITGYMLAKAEKTPLNKVIQGKEEIAIELLIPNVFLPDEGSPPFKVGEKAGITIRNRPYTQLKIIDLKDKSKLLAVPNLQGSYKTIVDPDRINTKDYLVTLADTALKTTDGYAIGGNKIKIGNQIELEGFKYRLKGIVIDIYPINNKQSERNKG